MFITFLPNYPLNPLSVISHSVSEINYNLIRKSLRDNVISYYGVQNKRKEEIYA